MKSPVPARLLCFIGAFTILASCASLKRQPNGQISVQMVSWRLVKKLAEPDAGLPERKVTVLKGADRSVIAEKSTDVSGTVRFDVPAGTYIVLGIGIEPETVMVESGQIVKLKVVVH
jgi:hypothetical protein